MDVLDMLDDVKEDIGRQLVTDETLREWAKELAAAVYDSDDIERAAGDTINTLMHECKQANFRVGANHFAIHNKILLARYSNLLRFVIDSLNIEDREEVLEYCWNVINGTDGQSQRETQPNKTKEPQQLAEREKKYFAKAIEAGLMQETDTGYEWIYQKGNKASLGYFLRRVFNPKGTAQMPYQRMEKLFNVSRLDTATDQALNAKKPQKWRKEIDVLFDD